MFLCTVITSKYKAKTSKQKSVPDDKFSHLEVESGHLCLLKHLFLMSLLHSSG